MISLCRQLVRLRSSQILSARLYSKDDPNVDQLFKKTLEKNKRDELKEKLKSIEKDSYDEAMPSQLSELGTDMERLLRISRSPSGPPRVSRGMLKRSSVQAASTLRRDAFQRALMEGMDVNKARNLAEKVTVRAMEVLDRNADKTIGNIRQKLDELRSEKAEKDSAEKMLYTQAYEKLEEIWKKDERPAHEREKSTTWSPRPVREKPTITLQPRVDPDPNAKSIFDDATVALNIFDVDKSTPAPLSFWAEMTKRKMDLFQLNMGPTNAFEEQILWTEQGKMWPYPIDNEYLIGDEENIHFTEHIFLNEYLEKYDHLPKTGPIATFLELVCIGLSKNPYMNLAKKHAHLDSFAEFFNPEQLKNMDQMYKEAELEANAVNMAV